MFTTWILVSAENYIINLIILLQMNIAGIREFECSSFTEFLAWKEEEEEKNNIYYAQTMGRKALSDNTNIGEIGTTEF